MRDDLIRDRYFRWMYQLVCNDRYSKRNSHQKLLRFLNDVEFVYILEMDGNRYEDGISLRYRFGDELGYSDSFIASALDDKPCSVLEMMVALALRCEEDIMDNPAVGDRVGQWFWTMIVNLDLGAMTDDKFDYIYARKAIDIFLNRDYAPDGRGGLFALQNPQRDMRDIEIWYQMQGYLNEIL